jgi:hypothetical protein
VLGLGLFLSEIVDGKLRGIFCGHLRSSTPDMMQRGELCPAVAGVV